MVLRAFAAVMAMLVATGGAFGQATPVQPPAKPAAAKPAAASDKPKPSAKPAAKPPAKPAAKPAKPASRSAAKPAPVPRADAPAVTDTDTAPDATPKPSTATQSVKDSYAALSMDERLSIQSDLVWTGDYNGLVNGEFSDRLVAAVKAFQRRNKTKDTGVLNPQERAILAASAKPLQDEVGWRLAEDAVTGARVGLPGKLAPETTRLASGTRWSSAQGQLQINTFRLPNAKLEAVYEQQRREPVGRKPAYNVLRSDFFVVSGTQGLKKFYVRAFARNGEVRGLTILYDQAMEGIMDPVVVAMSSAFVPFAAASGRQDGAQMRRKVEYGTGLVVSGNGHIITDKQLVDGCQVVTIPGLGHAERLAEDKSSDLALLRVHGVRDLAPVALLGSAPRGPSVTLIGISDPQIQSGGSAVSQVTAKLTASGSEQLLDMALAPGFSGAAAMDEDGRLAGMVALKSIIVAGPAPTPRAVVVPRERIVNFLEANYVAPSSGQSGPDAVKASTVRVICVHK